MSVVPCVHFRRYIRVRSRQIDAGGGVRRDGDVVAAARRHLQVIENGASGTCQEHLDGTQYVLECDGQRRRAAPAACRVTPGTIPGSSGS